MVVESDGTQPHRDLLQGRRADHRRQRRQGRQDRPQQAPRPFVVLQDVYGNTYTYAPPRRRRQDLSRAEGPPRRKGGRKAPHKDAEPKPADSRRHARQQGQAETRPGRAAVPAKERLFAHPERPAARAAGGDVQLADPMPRRLTQAAPLGFEPATSPRAAEEGRPPDRRHDPRPPRRAHATASAAPDLRDPPRRRRRPADRPEADPRRLEAARVDRDLPRQGQEPVLRRGRGEPVDRPDAHAQQGAARPPGAQRPAHPDLRLRPQRRPLRPDRPPRAGDDALPRRLRPEAHDHRRSSAATAT